MNKAFRNRIQFWETSNKQVTPNEISDFEKFRGILLPIEYKQLLLEYGKLLHTKTWYWYYEEDGSDHLIHGTLDLTAQNIMKSNIWDELVSANPNLDGRSFLPIISTHSNNYFFLIGTNESNNGKIFDYNYDYEKYQPKLVSNSISEFFTGKIFSSFSIHNQSEKGTIEIRRQKGIEFWDITSSNFSITKHHENYLLNFWVESDHKIIKALDDSGDTPVMFEIKLPLEIIPDFSNPWEFNYPDIKEISENWGEESEFNFYDNFYYYSHESFDQQKIEIVKSINETYYIRITGEKDDPISSVYGKAKYLITARLKIKNEFKGFWCEG
jgi:hypothetical protein